ncbi:unnamed protein product [Urochloa decumbens]|uniref:protein-serine/threonine phosphatase n=1 Tax=Urochloa decumbens TaxID=240449 RepID=A0ABC8ZNQ4_9POAL
MGASNSRSDPVIRKSTEGGENDRIEYGVSTIQRKNMKVHFAAVPDLDDRTSFFGVYDGHEGAEVALFCATQFHNDLRDHPFYEQNLFGAMKMTFFRMDELLEQSDEWKKLLPRGTSDRVPCLFLRDCIKQAIFPYIPPQESGSTACVAVIRGHDIVIGNVGHSRCIISRNGQAIELTTDHKPDHPIEKQRIERAGGEVTGDSVVLPGETEGFLQQGLGVARINGILAHSRAIGYFAFKSDKGLPPQHQMVTCDPGLRIVAITNDIEFLVIVSDGIWTDLTSQGVVDHIHKQLASGTTDLGIICQGLCDRCELSADNVTAILVRFKDAPPPEPEENLSDGNGNNSDDALQHAQEENLSGGNGNNSDYAPAPAPEENLSGGNGNSSDYAPAPAPEKKEEHKDAEPEGSQERPLLGGESEITED